MENNKFARTVKEAVERLAKGETPKTIFDYCDDFHDGFSIVMFYENGYKDKSNLSNLISDHKNFAQVLLKFTALPISDSLILNSFEASTIELY